MLPLSRQNPAPKLRDVRLASVALNQINISWYYDGHTDVASLAFLIYLNDRLVQRVGGEVREATIFAPGSGAYDVQVIPWRSDLRYFHTIYGAAAFRRLHIDFSAASVPLSIDAYQVYKLNTTTSLPELYDSKTAIAAAAGWYRFSLSSVWVEIAGSFSDSSFQTNSSVTVEYVAATDQLKVTSPSESAASYVFFRDNEIVDFYRGLSIRIEDKASLVDGDKITVLLGILPYYDTPVLEDGEHTFYVAALHRNGNVGTLSSAVSVTAYNPPPAPTDVGVAYSTASGWEIGGFSSSPQVRVYANYCPTTDALLPYVYFDYPIATVSTISGAFNVVLGELSGSGTLRLVCRSVDAQGVESDSDAPVEATLPYVSDALPDVIALSGEHIGGGSVRLTWFSTFVPPFNDTYPMGRWLVTTNESSISLLVEAEASINSSYIEWTVTLTDPPLTSVSETFTVAAADLAGTTTGTSSSVFVEIDTTAPAQLTINKSQGF